MCETSASHAGVGLGETLGVDLVGEAQAFTQGTGQVERRGETSCRPADYSSQCGELENWRTPAGGVLEGKAAQAPCYLISGLLMMHR